VCVPTQSNDVQPLCHSCEHQHHLGLLQQKTLVGHNSTTFTFVCYINHPLSRLVTHSATLSHTHTHTHTLSLSLSLSHSLSHTHETRSTNHLYVVFAAGRERLALGVVAMSGEAEAAVSAGTPAPKLAPAADVPSDDTSMEVEANGNSVMDADTLTNGTGGLAVDGGAAVDGNGTTEHAEAEGNDAMETDEVRGSKASFLSLSLSHIVSR
jgi:hypothetical protein